MDDLIAQIQQLQNQVTRLSESPSPAPAALSISWNEFYFKLPKELKLRGVDNFKVWHEALVVAMRAVGYRSGIPLTEADETKLAQAINSNVREGPLRLVSGLRRGSDMVARFKAVYEPQGEEQKTYLWDQLKDLQWDGSCPIEFTALFNQLVSQNTDIGNTTTTSQQRGFFFSSVSVDKEAKEWVARQRTLLRITNPTIFQLQTDFIAEFRAKIQSGEDGEAKAMNASERRRKDGTIVREGKCRKCGKPGHWAKECRNKEKDKEKETMKETDKKVATALFKRQSDLESLSDGFSC
jgi:hypothetical protein